MDRRVQTQRPAQFHNILDLHPPHATVTVVYCHQSCPERLHMEIRG